VKAVTTWCALVALALTATWTGVASADPPSPAPQRAPRKRPVPDYGGRPSEPKPARDVVLWVPRVILSPLYLVSEYVIRAPILAVLPAAEHAELPRKVYDFFTFGREHQAGIVPVGYFEFDANPSVGVYGFWNDAFAKGNDWSLHTEVWPSDWYAVSIRESARLDDRTSVLVHVSGVHRPDRVFFGIGPQTLQSSKSRFTEAVTEEGVMLDWKYLPQSHLQLTAGLRSESLGPGRFGEDPNIQQEAATGAFAVPYGYEGRYTVQYNRVLASLDTREPWPAPGSGVLVEAKAEQDSDVTASPNAGWIHYGAKASAFLDLDEHQHVVSLSGATMFVDPLGDSPIPFTDLVALGGDAPMRGYLPRRMLDRSSVVVALHYVWPIAPWLGGTMEAALGNVFGQHLQGFQPDLLRYSGDIGITTVGVGEFPIEAVVGCGSETFAQGGQVDSVRATLSVAHGF
jgi:hypothetical protein